MNAQLFVSLGFVFAGPVDPDRVLAEAARGWERYSQAIASAEGKMERVIMNDGVVMARGTAEFRSGPNARTNILATERRRKPTDPLQKQKVAFGVNSRYTFALEQPEKVKDGTWMIKSLVPAFGNKEEFDRVASSSVSPSCLEPVGFGKRPLVNLIRGPTFKLLKVEEVQRPEGPPVVRLEFDNTHPKDDFKVFPIQRGTIELDPASNWVRVKWDVIMNEGETVRGWLEYASPVDGLALPRKYRQEGEFTHPGGRLSKSVVESTYEFSTTGLPLQEKEASLPAFGLPEPLELAPKPWYTHWLVWVLIAAGCGFLGVGQFLRVRAAQAT